MKFTENTTLAYSKDVTKELYELLIQELERQGFKFFIHWRDRQKGNYEEFKQNAYLNIDPTGEWYGKNKGKFFTIDNNNQRNNNYIYAQDLLSLKLHEYEIY